MTIRVSDRHYYMRERSRQYLHNLKHVISEANWKYVSNELISIRSGIKCVHNVTSAYSFN